MSRQRRFRPTTLVALEAVEAIPVAADADHRMVVSRLTELIQKLKPLDREVIVSCLDGMDATEIGELTGLSPGNVATKIHRIKGILARSSHEGERHARCYARSLAEPGTGRGDDHASGDPPKSGPVSAADSRAKPGEYIPGILVIALQMAMLWRSRGWYLAAPILLIAGSACVLDQNP